MTWVCMIWSKHTRTHTVFTFSLWHIPQSGDDDLLDTGMMRQATPEEGSKTPPQSLQRSSQSIGIMHVAMCISVAHSDMQCVRMYVSPHKLMALATT